MSSTHPNPPPAPFHWFVNAWDRLCQPLAAVKDAEDRRKSRLMASLSLTLGLMLLPLFAFWSTTHPPSEIEVALSVIILLLLTSLAYFLSRRGLYQFACLFSIVVGTAVIIHFAVYGADQENRLNLIDYLAVILLYASLFVSMPTLLAVVVAELMVIISLTWLVPGVTLADIVAGPLEFNLVAGTMILLVTQHRNMLERNRRDELADSERQRARAEEFSSMVVTRTYLDGHWISISPRLCALTGYSEAELQRMTFSDITHPDDRAADIELAEQLIHGERKSYDLEKRYVRKDGGIVWIYLNCTMVLDTKDNPQYFLTYLRDITELKQTQETYRLLVDSALQGFIVYQDGRAVFANSVAGSLLGYTVTEMLALTAEQLAMTIHPDDREEVSRRMRECLMGQPVQPRSEFRFINKNAQAIWIEAFATLIEYRGRPALQFVFVDISERKRAEEALRKSEAKSRALIAAMPDLLFLQNREGVFLDIYASDPSLLLVPADQILGRNMLEIVPRELSQELTRIYDEAIRTGEIQVYEYPLELHGESRHFEARVLAYDDDKLLSFVRDITDRKKAEQALAGVLVELEERVAQRTMDLQKANERLTELDRLKTKFIDDISHELRTPLATLGLRLYLLERDEGDKRSDHLQVIKSELNQMNDMMKSILDFTELGAVAEQDKMGPVDLNDVVDQAVTASRTRAEEAKLALNFQPGKDLPMVNGIADFLMRAVANLLSNAIKYTPRGGIEVSTGFDQARQQVCIEVRDTGMGIASDDLPHLFEQFYRGRNIGSYNIPGSGLGLPIVKEIVDQHGGTVEVESQPEKGSTFRIWLPA